MGRDEMNTLLNALIPFAMKRLDENGEFYPFGAKIGPDGKTVLVAGNASGERPPSQEVIDMLVAGLREEAKRGDVRATAICTMVTVQLPVAGKTDAVRVTLEDTGGEAVNAFLPYDIGAGRKVTYGEMEFGRADPLVFQPAR